MKPEAPSDRRGPLSFDPFRPLLFYLHDPLTVAKILGEANILHLLGVPILPVIVRLHLHGGFYLLPCHYCFSGAGTARGRWPLRAFVFGRCLFCTASWPDKDSKDGKICAAMAK